MNQRLLHKALYIFLFGYACLPLCGATWYVRPDGGTRYSANVTAGKCDGRADAPYPGTGANQHCAFNDVRMLYQDGTYTLGPGSAFPSWGWVIAGGDTVIIRGSIGTGASYRIGHGTSAPYCDPTGCWYYSGAPPPPSGTSSQHTRILGENYASCRSASAKTQLHGGGGTYIVLDLSGSSYTDVACLDITDYSACGRAGQALACDPTQDFAQFGVKFSNTSTHDKLTDMNIHGLAAAGMVGPTGDGVVMDYIDVLGNASSGWNSDFGDGTTGKGSLLVQHFNISWNGCAEEYPVVHQLPYAHCTDEDHGGYGDGFGTATKDSDPPGWQVHFDRGTVSYNTQDGLDALHIGGKGSTMTVTHTLAFSNMGQQLKVGGATATLTDNLIVGNCKAMSNAIPGTPSGYNAQLGEFCRAGDTAVVILVSETEPAAFQRNIVYSSNLVALEVEYLNGHSSSTATIKYDDNIFVGFPNWEGVSPSPIYSNTDLKMFTNPGASFNHNVTYHAKSNWQCPAISLHETAGSCGNPHLKDESWHAYGFGDASPGNAASAGRAAVDSSSQRAPNQFRGHSDASIAIGSLGAAALVTGMWRGIRHLLGRATKA